MHPNNGSNLQANAPAAEREYAEVATVYNSPGPGQDIRYDIILRREGGASPSSLTVLGVKSIGQVPGDNGTLQYDIIGARAGTPCVIHRRAGNLYFMVPYAGPLTGTCPGAGGGGGGGDGNGDGNGGGDTGGRDIPNETLPGDGIDGTPFDNTDTGAMP